MAENKDCDCLTQESQIDSIMEDETQLDANLEEDGELGSELENVVEVSKVYTGGETKDAIVHVDNEKNIITATLQKMWFSSFQEFPAVGSDNLIYADKGTGVLYTYNNETNSYDELINEPQITIDTEMSDTSENAVQNKVIKSYVDTEVNTINGEIDSLGNTVTDVENKINGINTSITTINDNISTIEGEIGQINSDITGIKGDLDGKASLGGDNVFSGKQTLNGEIEVNSGASFNRDVTLTDASLKILDNTTDTATTYKATSIDIENNGGTKTTLTLPKKNGTILTDADINLKHSKIQNADTVNEEIDEIRIVDPESRFKIASQVENNQTELNVERNYIAMKHAGTSGSAEVSLSSNDAVIQSTDLNGNVTNVTVTPTSAQLNGKDIVTTKGAEFEQRPTVKDNGTAVDVVLKSDLENYVPSQSENGTHYSQVNNQDGQFSVHISKNGETADLHNLIINKDGVFITGKVKLQGDADISGIVTVKETETLKVKDNIVVTNADGVDLVDMSGLGIRKNSSDTYGIVYDPASDSVKLGLGKLDNSGKFTFNEGEGQPVAVRDDSSLFVDGHLVKWNATSHKFVDCGKDVSDSATANSIASRTADGALKATPISDIDIENQTDNTVATKKDIKGDVKTTDLKNLSLNTTADGYWSYDSNTSKIKENGGTRTYTYNTQKETEVPSFSYLARATDIEAITNAHNNLADKVALKQDALTAGENITISDDNVISASGGTSIDIVQGTGTSTTAVMSQDATTKELNTKLKTNTFNLYVGTTDACSNANGDFGQCSQIYNNDGTFYADRKFLLNKNDFAQEGQDAEKKYSLASDVMRTSAISQETGNSVDKVISQKTTTDELNKKFDKAGGNISGEVSIKDTNGTMISHLNEDGTTDYAVSYKTNAFEFGNMGKNLRLLGNTTRPKYETSTTEEGGVDLALLSDIPNVPSVSQSTGTSTTDVMSQKATTDELAKKIDKTGGTFTGAVKFNESDGQCINFDNGFYVNKTGGSTLIGTNGTNAWVGTSDTALTMRGNATRPTYNGNDLGLKSDLDSSLYTLNISVSDTSKNQSGTIASDLYAKLLASKRPVVKVSDSSISISLSLWTRIDDSDPINTSFSAKSSGTEYYISFSEYSGNNISWSYDVVTTSSVLLNKVYPVGSMFLSISSTSPASFLGGSWELLGADAYFKIVTANAGQLGGVSNHTISISNMPSHSHKIASSNSYSNDIIGYGYNANSQGVGGTKTNKTVSYYTNDRSGHQVIQDTGGGTAYYPYYYGVYAWKRTN